MQAFSGARAESAAQAFLEHQGLTLIARNVRSKWGEIDLIMLHGQILVFVEVRLRKRNRFATAAESIDRRKQQRLRATADSFRLRHKNLQDRPCRFDVIAYDVERDTLGEPQWIRRAFA